MTEPDTEVLRLSNGVRVAVSRLSHLRSVYLSVFVRTGSAHEAPALNGISHFAEHMAFKGTHERSCQQINLDAERLGAEVNAHTDKEHTAYHIRGLAPHAERFVHLLGDIVLNSAFPEAELERERQVILQELLEDEDDGLSTAFKLFDKLCFGSHPVGQPVIGTRRNIERFTRAELQAYVQRQYTGANLVLAVAGDVDPQAIARAAEQAFGGLPAGQANEVAPAHYAGGLATRRLAGVGQTHIVLGFPIASLREPHHADVMAAAVLGEGMSSPLMDEIRERRGLVYYAACSADVMSLAGQFVIEASTSPQHLHEFVAETARLLRRHAERVDAVDLERARNQLALRQLDIHERPFRRLEETAQDLFVHGRVRPRQQWTERLEAVSADDVRSVFQRMLAQGPAFAAAGKVPADWKDRTARLLAGP
ncbi:MAG: pitrilysin family protein [Pseudomonadota bacterium]